MDTLIPLAVIAFAALIHASFQLSVSVLSLLTSHSIGSKKSHRSTMRLMFGFIVGTVTMTVLGLAFLCLISTRLFSETPQVLWAASAGLLVGIGVAVWLFYYRRGIGTTLWIPRNFAAYLGERSKATKRSAEAFGLGLSSVAAELLFIGGPLIVAALAVVHLPGGLQLAGLGMYALISLLPLLIVYIYVGSGHKLSAVQRWRESNKRFLQFAGGAGLIVLGFFIYVNEVAITTTNALGGGGL